MTTLKYIIPLLFLLPSLCNGWANYLAYEPYPSEAADILNQTTLALADSAPKVVTLNKFPGHDLFQHLQQVAVRNSIQNPLFHLDVNYIMKDGLAIACRTANGGSGNSTDTRNKDHSPNHDAAWCDDHCTHKGRYCPTDWVKELAEKTPHNGAQVVLEILRRLCFGSVLDQGFSNPAFYKYLEEFEKADCLKSADLGACSKNILASKMGSLKFDTEAGSPFDQCVSEADAQTDTTNPLLEHQLDVSHRLNYQMEELPILEIGGELFHKSWGSPRADRILHKWCDHFHGEKPVGCDFCAPCHNVKNCLWYANCDGHTFSIDTYKHPLPEKTPVQEVEEEVVKDTKEVLGMGILIGVGGMAALWCLTEIKRKRAVREVAKELPVDGFRDSSDVELPHVS